MRAGKSLSVSPADIRRLKALFQDRDAPQKHVWRVEIAALAADGVGTNGIMQQTGKSKTGVWRWQERFIDEGFDGLLRDKAPPCASNRWVRKTERVVALRLGEPLGDRGRDAHYCAPPAQNRTCGFPAYGSHLGCLTAKRSLGQG
jgi:hypothetical protein